MAKIRYASEAIETLNRALGDEGNRLTVVRERTQQKRERVVAFGDTHAPFVRWDQLARMFKATDGFDRAILMGDLDDGYAISKYIKYDRVPYLKGLAGAKAIIESAAEHYDNVDVLIGNHDTPRLLKALHNTLDPDVIDAIKFLDKTGGKLCPITAIAAEYPNVRIAGRNLTSPSQSTGDMEQRSIHWLHQFGDVVFTHAERFSKKSGQAAESVADHLNLYRKVFQLKPFRVVIQAHTHQLAWRPWGADGLVVESGCLAHTPAYAFDAKCAGVPQRNGYITFETEDGKVDINSVRPHWLED